MFAVERDSALTGGVGSRGQTEVERTVAGLVMHGRVVAADYPNARLRVGIGDPEDPEGYITTGWLPFKGGRAGNGDGEWDPPEIGEAVTVLSESGELQNGVVERGSIYNVENPPPGDRAGLYRRKFKNGAVFEYDRETGAMLFDATGSGTITLKAGGCLIVLSGGVITIKAGEIVTDGTTRLNKGTRGVVFRGSKDSDGDTNIEGAGNVYV